MLFVLWLAGPLESRHVARLAGMSRAAVSALVKTLERDGLVTRTQVPSDRRAVITAMGRGFRNAWLLPYVHRRLSDDDPGVVVAALGADAARVPIDDLLREVVTTGIEE